MTLFLNPKNAAHARDNITERGLFFIQLARHLDLDAGKHGHVLAHHVRRDLYLGPPAKVGPSLGSGMQRTRFLQDKNIRLAAQDLTRPSHAGVDAKKALVRRQRCQDISYAFLFGH